jgi:hypothetical protein
MVKEKLEDPIDLEIPGPKKREPIVTGANHSVSEIVKKLTAVLVFRAPAPSPKQKKATLAIPKRRSDDYTHIMGTPRARQAQV